jgi:hypothetical protein
MSETFDWPSDLTVSAFSLRLRRNTRTFTSPSSGSSQTVEFGGERWVAEVTIAPTARQGMQSLRREVLMDKLAGGLNRVRMYHRFNTTAGGTFTAAPVAWAITDGGSPWPVTNSGSAWPITDGTLTLREPVAAGLGTCVLQTRPGRTATEGSMLGINGQLVRVMADATADSAGRLTLTVAPRARYLWPAYSSPVVTDRPTAPFKMAGDAPTSWSAGIVASTTFDLIEDIN